MKKRHARRQHLPRPRRKTIHSLQAAPALIEMSAQDILQNVEKVKNVLKETLRIK